MQNYVCMTFLTKLSKLLIYLRPFLVLSVFILVASIETHADELIDYLRGRENVIKSLSDRLIGSYEDASGRLLTINLPEEETELKINYLDPGAEKASTTSFVADLDLENSIKRVKDPFYGRGALRVVTHEFNGRRLKRVVEVIDLLKRRKEVLSVLFEFNFQGDLTYTYSRRYYKRNFSVFGEWVEDFRNPQSQLNKVPEVREVYKKISPDLINLNEIANQNLHSGLQSYFRLLKPTEHNQKTAYDLITEGEFEIVYAEKTLPSNQESLTAKNNRDFENFVDNVIEVEFGTKKMKCSSILK